MSYEDIYIAKSAESNLTDLSLLTSPAYISLSKSLLDLCVLYWRQALDGECVLIQNTMDISD